MYYNRNKKAASIVHQDGDYCGLTLSALVSYLVRDGELPSSLGPACRQDAPAGGS